MNISKYLGNDVKIEFVDGELMVGFASGFTDKENDSENKNILTVIVDGVRYGLDLDEIKKIVIMK